METSQESDKLDIKTYKTYYNAPGEFNNKILLTKRKTCSPN